MAGIAWNLLSPSRIYTMTKRGLPMDEPKLVALARRGDASAFTELVTRYERPMYALACSILRSQWDAADAVQDAFTEAFEHIRDLRDPSRFRPWLSRIVVNKCNQMFRDSARLVLVEQPPDIPAASDTAARDQSMDLIRAVRSLDEEHRNTVALRYFCDLRLEDVADIMGCPVGTVKSRLNRALTRLQLTLQPQGERIVGPDVQEVAR